jgi:outer membrane protein assembly factor BamB
LSVAVSGGYVYVCAGDELLCLDAANGAKMWAFTAGGKLSTPSLAASYVYVGSADGNAYCIRASDGAKMWNYTTEYNNAGPSHNYHWGNRVSDIAIADNYVYFGSSNFQAYCLDAVDGSKVWNYTTNAGVYSAPSVGSETVLVGSYDGNLYCLNSTDANELWSYPVGVYSPVNAAGSAGSAAIADNTIYVVGNGMPYALSEPKTGDSSFPLTYVIVALVVVVCVVLAVAVLLRRR